MLSFFWSLKKSKKYLSLQKKDFKNSINLIVELYLFKKAKDSQELTQSKTSFRNVQ